jgi:hypothetical protein
MAARPLPRTSSKMDKKPPPAGIKNNNGEGNQKGEGNLRNKLPIQLYTRTNVRVKWEAIIKYETVLMLPFLKAGVFI